MARFEYEQYWDNEINKTEIQKMLSERATHVNWMRGLSLSYLRANCLFSLISTW